MNRAMLNRVLNTTTRGIAVICGLSFSATSAATIINFETYYHDQVGWAAPGILFDFEVKAPEGILIHGFQVDLQSTHTPGTANIDLYTLAGTSAGVGSGSDIADWDHQAFWEGVTRTGVRGNPSVLGDMDFAQPLELQQGVYGMIFYIRNADEPNYVLGHVRDQQAWSEYDVDEPLIGDTNIDVMWGRSLSFGTAEDPLVSVGNTPRGVSMNVHYEVIPEPSLAALAAGVLGLAWVLFRRRRR